MNRMRKPHAPRSLARRIIDLVASILVSTLLLPTNLARAQAPQPAETGVIAPEIVRLEKVRIEGDVKIVTVGNAKARYTLICNMKADGCITPEASKNYQVFTKDTRWKRPGAEGFLSLQFMQDWTTSYNNSENIGLIAEEGEVFGVYILEKRISKTAYYQDTVTSDGPIIYGTGLGDMDRVAAWKHFFMTMVEACGRQQGAEILGVKLAKRCIPGENVCSIGLDANLTGVGGIQEPRKVVVIVIFDAKNQELQLSRAVCTYPDKNVRVCRDWSTGKLLDDDLGDGDENEKR